MNRGSSITRKVNLILLISVTIGLGATITYYAVNGIIIQRETTEENLVLQGDLLYQSIKNAMLPGQASLAVALFEDIKGIKPDFKIALYRSSGTEAFSDNSTVQTVNENLGRPMFPLKTEVLFDVRDISDDPNFLASRDQRRELMFPEQLDSKLFMTIYSPLLNLPKCTACHGSSHIVRGVLKISDDITDTISAR